ncbi:MAG: 5'-nucleotidase C-terminal domain-containing protein [Gemmatimonadaceae bacterium]
MATLSNRTAAERGFDAPVVRGPLVELLRRRGAGGRALRGAAVFGALVAIPSIGNSTPTSKIARFAAKSAATQPAKVHLVIAATTDTHGRVRGWDYYANRGDAAHGLSRLATIVDSVRQANPRRVVLVDAGDLLQGNPMTSVAAKVTRGAMHPSIAAMNVMKYDAAVVGNHEFNYGVAFLDSTIRQATFPFLAGNVLNVNGKAHYPSTTTVVRDGIRIAIVGATTQGSNVWDKVNLASAKLRVADVVSSVRTAVATSRAAGADVVVVVLHSGIQGEQSYDTLAVKLAPENVADRVAKGVAGIDLIVFGHTHREVADTTINGVLLMQPKFFAASVGLADLSMQKSGAKWKVVEKHSQVVQAAGHVESPAVLAVTEAAHSATLNWVGEPIGTTNVAWRGDSSRVVDTPLTDFMLETMKRLANSDLAGGSVFTLDAKFDSGAVNFAEISQLYPYDNTLRAVRIDGKKLRAYLEHATRYYRTLNADGGAPANGIVDKDIPGYNFDIVAGADYTIDLRKPLGQRITSLKFKGRDVVDGDSFTIALNNYRQGGGGGFTMFTGAPVVFAKEVDMPQLLADEVKRAGVLKQSDYFKQNWHIEPTNAISQIYAEQHRLDAAFGEQTPPKERPSIISDVGSNDPQPRPQSTRTLRIIGTSDFHAALEGRKDDKGVMRGGAVALKSAIVKARDECKDTCTSINIDGGDLFSGTPASDWNSGLPTVAAMNRMGISAGALGNHEFDFGQDTLKMRLKQLIYRALAANVVGEDGNTPSWIRADTIVVRDGLRIGIVGIAAQFTPTSTHARNVKGLKFLPEAPAASERIRALRAQNVDAVILTAHDGARCQSGISEGCAGSGIDMVKALTEKPDAVILAHAHTNMLLRINDIPVVQMTSNGRALGVIDIPLSPKGVATAEVRDVTGDVSVDPVLDTIVKNAVDRVRTRLERPVATIAETMKRPGEIYPLGNIMADVARVMTNSDFGTWNNGGIRADLPAGPMTFGMAHELSPFGNVLVQLKVRGKDMSGLFESIVRGKAPNSHISGFTITYDSTLAPGKRITSLTKTDGSALDPNKIYTLGLNDYMIDDANFMRPELVISTDVLPIVDQDAIAEYFKRLPQPVKPPTEVRIRNVVTPHNQ